MTNTYDAEHYQDIFANTNSGDSVTLIDYIYGFDDCLNNEILSHLDQKGCSVTHHMYYEDSVKSKYKNINFLFDAGLQNHLNLIHFANYRVHPDHNYKNFVCSFNGSDHVSRQLLASVLGNQGLFNSNYASKNFVTNNDQIAGHLDHLGLTEPEVQLYSKFFSNSDEFNNTVYSFGHHRADHKNNIYNLEHKLTQSFLHIVSESVATSYYPFVTEKFLYSIVTRGLFLTYAQPGWHKHIEKYYGFKLYDTIFDYSFDEIQNPVKRLVRLMETVLKFSKLSTDDWRDLYCIEQENIEYNYDHYFSGNYLKQLAQYK